jgi:peptidoglycan/xylan/chitin deacetylase (PgdA/CDA1 family)
MNKPARVILLRTLRALGGFRLARRLTRGGLRILAYHGFSLRDEHMFRGLLFMREYTFHQRMALIARQGYPVLSLDRAMEGLRRGSLPPNAVVITVDDGWYSFGAIAAPALKAHDFPATVYVTTYYAEKRTCVFNVLVQYLFWRTALDSVDLADLGLGLRGRVRLSDAVDRQRAIAAIIEKGDTLPDAAAREELGRRVAGVLGIDFGPIERLRMFRLLDMAELKALAAQDIDIQLHTHRHRLPPDDRGTVEREIADNRRALAPVANRALDDFCYPSGNYDERLFPWLREAGIRGATTCNPGFNYKDTEPLALGRFLDGENIALVEFEAELAGVLELARRWRKIAAGALRNLRAWPPVLSRRPVA